MADRPIMAIMVEADGEEKSAYIVSHVDAIAGLDGKYDTSGSAATVQQHLNTHINDRKNPHYVSSKDLGLENVDNTSDEDKPISKKQQTEFSSIRSSIQLIENKISEISDSGINKELVDMVSELTRIVNLMWNYFEMEEI